MSTYSFIPKNTCLEYVLNIETGYYQKQPSKLPFLKLPFELRVEPTQELKIKAQGAQNIIRGRIKNGKYQFFTGLVPICAFHFQGDYVEFIKGAKIKSLILFRFSEDYSKLTVFCFSRFYKENPIERNNFLKQFINRDIKG